MNSTCAICDAKFDQYGECEQCDFNMLNDYAHSHNKLLRKEKESNQALIVLFKKYIQHIIYAEGVDYIDPAYYSRVKFTKDEKKTLKFISKELKGRI